MIENTKEGINKAPSITSHYRQACLSEASVRGCILKRYQARDSLKRDCLREYRQELVTINRRHFASFDELMQRMGDREHRIVCVRE